MGESPESVGGLKLTIACRSPAVATTPIGAVGPQNGVTALLGADAAPGSVPFAAVTTKVYEPPCRRPVTVSGLDVPVAVAPPGVAVTAYAVTVPLAGEKATVARSEPAVAVTFPGTPGGGAAMYGLSARSRQPGMCARK